MFVECLCQSWERILTYAHIFLSTLNTSVLPLYPYLVMTRPATILPPLLHMRSTCRTPFVFNVAVKPYWVKVFAIISGVFYCSVSCYILIFTVNLNDTFEISIQDIFFVYTKVAVRIITSNDDTLQCL